MLLRTSRSIFVFRVELLPWEKFYLKVRHGSCEIHANRLGVVYDLLVTFNKIADLSELVVEAK